MAPETTDYTLLGPELYLQVRKNIRQLSEPTLECSAFARLTGQFLLPPGQHVDLLRPGGGALELRGSFFVHLPPWSFFRYSTSCPDVNSEFVVDLSPREEEQGPSVMSEDGKVYSLSSLSGLSREVLELKRLLEQHYQEDLKIGDLCRSLDARPNTLGKRFRRAFGFSAKHYLTRLRVIESLRLMLASMPVTQAAFESGFQDFSRFSKSFKSLTGYSPRGYLNSSSRVSKNAKP